MQPSVTTRTLVLGIALAACDQDVEEPDQTVGGGDDSGEAGETGYLLEITADGSSAEVGLGGRETVEFEGDQVVPLIDVLDASGLDVDWSERTFDFLASDGYRPSQRDCAPVDYAAAQGGYFHPASGNLVWETDLGLPGCYYVDGVVKVEVQDAR